MTAADLSPDLYAIQARADAATEGPWETMRAGMLGTRVVHVDGEWEGLVPDEFITLVTPSLRKYDDANFMAHARTDVPALLALVREQRAAIERVRSVHYEGVAYADDIAEGGDEEVPEDYKRHYCNEDGEDWPCPTIAALTATEGVE